MGIERLKELREVLNHSLFYFGRKSGKTNFPDTLFDVLKLIDEAIARQSATSDEVAEAIEQLKYAREQDREFDDGTFVDSLDLAITALQAYQPTTRKNRIVEEVAISKTATTSARALSCWYCTEIEKHGVVAVKTVLDKAGRNLDAYETPCNYCPNCGRRLED